MKKKLQQARGVDLRSQAMASQERGELKRAQNQGQDTVKEDRTHLNQSTKRPRSLHQASKNLWSLAFRSNK